MVVPKNSLPDKTVRPKEKTVDESFFGRRRWLWITVLVILFSAGTALRTINLTNPPLDLHAWRQLRGANIARAMYYNMLLDAEPAQVDQATYLSAVFQKQEPRIFERITAMTYLIAGGEYLWIARLYAILFWMVGGGALFLLARRMSNIDGALLATAYYLFLPYGVTHSRLFLPDLLMMPFIILGLLAAHIWTQERTWKWAILAGILCGVAILAKVFAVFFLFIPIALLVLSSRGLLASIRSTQTWTVFGLMLAIPALHYFVLSEGTTAGGYIETWSLPFLRLLLDIHFYISWFHKLGVFNLTLLVIGMGSLLLLQGKDRWMVLGLWAAYLAYGMSLAAPIRSHSYYSLPLVPVVALSLAPLGSLALGALTRQKLGWQIALAVMALTALGDSALMARKDLTAEDYRAEPAFWQALGKDLPTTGNITGLSEDYNTRLQYYGWRFMLQYSYYDDLEMGRLSGHDFDPAADNWKYFLDMTQTADFFLVTTLDEFEKQPYLKEVLYNYYPIVMQAERYVLFDLKNPLQPIPNPE
jgi:hypothetical protein